MQGAHDLWFARQSLDLKRLASSGWPRPKETLNNYLRCQGCVKNRLTTLGLNVL